MNLDGSIVDQTLSYSAAAAAAQWEDMAVHYVGTIGTTGSHTLTMTSPTANAFGCGTVWGGLDLIVVDDPRIVRSWRVADPNPGCPGTRPANAVLMTLTFTQVSSDATVWVSGHTIRQYRFVYSH